jgi:cytosine/adenosine deaminase-related metal-dependent hydrolase
MILRAHTVLPMMDRPPLDDGAVVVVGDSIAAVGLWPEIRAAHQGEARDLGNVVLLPGLINAHCHLDYTGMAGQIAWRSDFADWIQQIVEQKKAQTGTEYAAAVRTGLEQLARTGTTTVVNIEAFPPLIAQFTETPIRIWWCPELIDLGREGAAKLIVRDTVEFLAAHENPRGGAGLAPHALYTASRSLYRAAVSSARSRNWMLTTHLAESEEEDMMFRRGTGVMYDYFKRLGRNMSDCKHGGMVRALAEVDALGPNFLAVHANYLTMSDAALLKQSGAHVALCPRSHEFFKRRLPLLPMFQEQGINVCLGTDSLASNDQLNLFAEMQTLARQFGAVSPEYILRLVTTGAAKALNRSKKLGKLAAGALADMIAVPQDAAAGDPYEAVVFSNKPVSFSMVGGKALLL